MKDTPSLSARDQVSLRFVARAIDLFFWLWLVCLIVWALVQERAFHREWQLKMAPWLLLLLASTMLLDAIVHRLFRTTPGRSLIGVAVHTRERRPLSLRQHLRRNGAVWFSGLACYVFPFYIFTFVRLYRHLLKGNPAPYDERHGYRVTVDGSGPVKLALFILVVQSFITVGGLATVFRNLITP